MNLDLNLKFFELARAQKPSLLLDFFLTSLPGKALFIQHDFRQP